MSKMDSFSYLSPLNTPVLRKTYLSIIRLSVYIASARVMSVLLTLFRSKFKFTIFDHNSWL